MKSKAEKGRSSIFAFTLIELVIVLVIVGILLMATLYLSGEQIQKVRDKTVKESILAEMQSRYSRNLGSSSYAGMMYNTLDVTFSGGENKIDFKYNTKSENENDNIENTFTDKFEIKDIIKNHNFNESIPDNNKTNNIKLTYSPYQITCKIGEGEDGELQEENNNVVMIIRVNDSRDYCFEVQKKNCRLMEMAGAKCEVLKDLLKK